MGEECRRVATGDKSQDGISITPTPPRRMQSGVHAAQLAQRAARVGNRVRPGRLAGLPRARLVIPYQSLQDG